MATVIFASSKVGSSLIACGSMSPSRLGARRIARPDTQTGEDVGFQLTLQRLRVDGRDVWKGQFSRAEQQLSVTASLE